MTSYTRQKRIRKGSAAAAPVDLSAVQQSLDQAEKLLQGALSQVDQKEVKVDSPNDLYKLSIATVAIVKAKTELDRWRCEREGLLQEASDRLTDLVRETIAEDPELTERVIECVERATAKCERERLMLPEGEDDCQQEQAPPYSGNTPPPLGQV